MTTLCAYCDNEEDVDVVLVGSCAAKCEIHAHATCFAMRRNSTVWKKKHCRESNGCAEICPMPTCTAKMRKEKSKLVRSKHTSQIDAAIRRDLSKDEQQEHDPTTMCNFKLKDGRDCFRSILQNGACRLHAHCATVKESMLAKQHECTALNEERLNDAPEEISMYKDRRNDAKKASYDAEDEVVTLRAELHAMRETMAKMQEEVTTCRVYMKQMHLLSSLKSIWG